MSEGTCIRTGKSADREPSFRPKARGMLLLTKKNPKHELTDDDYMTINLHAQKELCALSPDYEKAQKHWSTLPRTPARQLENGGAELDDLSDVSVAKDWLSQFDDYPGLIYIFDIEREVDLRSGTTRTPFPVVGFSLTGFHFLDDLDDPYCIRYRIWYIYAE